jgi:hypothetical protein
VHCFFFASGVSAAVVALQTFCDCLALFWRERLCPYWRLAEMNALSTATERETESDQVEQAD